MSGAMGMTQPIEAKSGLGGGDGACARMPGALPGEERGSAVGRAGDPMVPVTDVPGRDTVPAYMGDEGMAGLGAPLPPSITDPGSMDRLPGGT